MTQAAKKIFISLVVVTAVFNAVAVAQFPAADPPLWRTMTIRWHQQYDQQIIGGEGEQHPHAMTRSISDPDTLYLGHDVSQIWRSSDNGHSWQRMNCRGMHVRCAQAVAVDPVISQTVIAAISNAWDWRNKQLAGLYRSIDGGESFEQVLAAPVTMQRINQRTIVYDPASLGSDNASRWYAAITGDKLYHSSDGGKTWSPRGHLGTFGAIYQIQCIFGDGNTLLMACEKGLFKSSDGGESFEPLGDIPVGEISSVFVQDKDGKNIFAVRRDRGLYLSEDHGRSFYLIKDYPAQYLFADSKQADYMFLTGTKNASIFSRDAGKTWQKVHVTPPAGHPAPQWKGTICGPQTGICPDPREAGKAVAFSRATIWRCDDGEGNFVDSSTLFTGFAWGWGGEGAVFDMYNPQHFWLFCNDIGMVETTNAGRWFERHGIPHQWYNSGKVSWTGMYRASQQPVAQSQTLIATAGYYQDSKLVFSSNAGHSWQLLDVPEELNLFVAFHPLKPQIVYAGKRISRDGGKNFELVEPLAQYNAEMIGMPLGHGDTVYAIDKARQRIYRSDDTGLSWREYFKADWRLAPMDSKPTFACDPSNADVIYTIDSSGDLIKYDGKKITDLNVLELANTPADAQNYVRRIAIDPREPKIIYAATDLPGTAYLFRSTDGGKTFVDITGNHPLIGAAGLVVNPHTGELFTGGMCGTRILPPPYKSPNCIYYTLPDNWLDEKQAEMYFIK